MPIPMAIAAETRIPQKISWIVLQSARLTIGYTRSWDRELWPQSPWTNLTSQSLYWTTSGSSRPSRARSRSMAWGSRDERSRAVGSKVARTKPNRRNDAIRRTGIEYARRRATYENTAVYVTATVTTAGPGTGRIPLCTITAPSLLVQPPQVAVEERAHDGVVADGPGDLLAPEEDVWERVDRQGDVVVGADAVSLLVGGHAGALVGVVVDLRVERGQLRHVDPAPVLTGELVGRRRDVLRALDRAVGRRERSKHLSVEGELVVALGQDAAEQVARLHVVDRQVEPGRLQLLLQDLLGELVALVPRRAPDLGRELLAVLGPDAVGALRPARRGHQLAHLAEVER